MKTTDEAVPIILDALAAGLQEDWPLAFSRWADACEGEPADGYTAACAVANLVSRIAASRSAGAGPMVAEVFRTGAACDPAEEQRVALVAAFIAAQGNRDSAATLMLFRRLLADEDEAAIVAFLTTIFEICVATVAGMRNVA